MNSEIQTSSFEIDMRIKFSVDQQNLLDKYYINCDSAINTPVVVDGIPVGVITDMWINEKDNSYCEVKCIIWTQFLERFAGKDFGVTLYMDISEEFTVMSIDSIK